MTIIITKTNQMRLFLLFLISLLSFSEAALGDKKLSVPRFVSIKSNEANARIGPNIKSRIEWVFVKKGEPVEVVAEYGQWRQVKDIEGQGGWVHSSVLSGKRSVVVTAKEIIDLKKKPDNNGHAVARLAPGVRCSLSKCKEDWCKISCNSHQGWLNKEHLFGIYHGDEF